MTHYELIRRIDTKCLLLKAHLPFVVSIGFRFTKDHAGDDALFFGVVLSDEAAKKRPLMTTTRAVEDFLRERLSIEPADLFWYFNWRSESEMKSMWAQHPSNNLNNQGYGWEDVVEARQRQTQSQLEYAGGNK